ncbi:MAG: hypothetical protein SPH68_06075 [Candidatus Borkfalkiaceae bacterium]|nr:hypothetical protein [Clostridia bacterium]MDY6223707.1 hypothetical protein [Christensenellaceae bacterium]
MYFRNEHHRQAFREGMKKTNRKDKETVSAVYLLSAEPCLWRRAKQASVYGKILLNNVRLSGITEDGYILLGAAKDIKYGTKYLTLGDLSDRSLVSPKIYKLISQALQLRRCGLAAVQEVKRGRV